MKAQLLRFSSDNRRRLGGIVMVASVIGAAVLLATPPALASITWDGQANNGLWFDPVNWSFEAPGGTAPFYLPTSNGNPYQAQDALMNNSPAGTGIIYDPLGADATNYANATSPDFDYPIEEDPRFDRDTFWRFYVSGGGAAVNIKVTMKSGSIEFIDKATSLNNMGVADGGSLNCTIIIGRGGASPGIEGRFVQEGGYFNVNEGNLDIGNFQTNPGNGFYEYKGGILEAALENDTGLRLGASGSSGPAGNGTLIIHSSNEAGRIRVWDFAVAAGLGGSNTISKNSMGKVEFHADFDGTRPVQVLRNLSINHQDDSAGTSGNRRSAILDLMLDAAPQVDGGGVPINLGLFDVDFDDDDVGDITGVTDDSLNPFVGEDDIFHTDTWANGGLPLTEGSVISADFDNVRYNWTLSYRGTISWANMDDSVVGSISASSDPDSAARDVVLIGLSSEILEPDGLPGDYNGDHLVDAADYTVWRNNLSTNFNLSGNGDESGASAGTVDEADYAWWKQHYGNSDLPPGGGGIGTSGAVPEPASFALLLIGMAGLCRNRSQGGSGRA